MAAAAPSSSPPEHALRRPSSLAIAGGLAIAVVTLCVAGIAMKRGRPAEEGRYVGHLGGELIAVAAARGAHIEYEDMGPTPQQLRSHVPAIRKLTFDFQPAGAAAAVRVRIRASTDGAEGVVAARAAAAAGLHRLPAAIHGLEQYAAPAGGSPVFYLHRGPGGSPDTVIACAAHAHCKLEFSALPAIRAELALSMPPAMLGQWQQLRDGALAQLQAWHARPSAPHRQQPDGHVCSMQGRRIWYCT